MKKYLPFLIALLFAANTKAQYVLIYDNHFEAWLKANGYAQCMVGDQLDTTCAAVVNARSVNCSGAKIGSLIGIEYFDNLDTLNCSNNSLNRLPPLPAGLKVFDCSHNILSGFTPLQQLTYLDCSENRMDTVPTLSPTLKVLRCTDNYIKALPTLPLTLDTLDCSDNITSLTALPALPPSLRYLNCYYNHIAVLPALPATLTYLNCGWNNLTALPALPPQLVELDFDANDVTVLPTLPAALKVLICAQNEMTSLPALPDSLTYFRCEYCQLTSLPSLPKGINTFACDYNYLVTLPALPDSLQIFSCEGNQLTSLPTLPHGLFDLSCRHNKLTSLPAIPAGVSSVLCSYNLLTTLPVLPDSVDYLECHHNNLTSLPAFPYRLYQCDVSFNPNLYCLPPLKKYLGNENFNFSIEGTGITCLPNAIAHAGYYPAIDTMPICDLFNQHNCDIHWNLQGATYQDNNDDCMLQTAEKGVSVKVNLFESGNLVQSWYSTGNYSFKAPSGTYTIVVDTANSPFISNCTTDSTVTLTPTDSLINNINFGLRCKTGIDVGAKSILGAAFRPGTTRQLNIGAGDISNFYNGHCADGTGGTVTVNITGPVKYISPATGALTPTTVNGGILTWNIADFGPVRFNTDFNLMFRTDTTAVLGSPVCVTVSVTSNVTDINPANNILTQCFRVGTSYDPNDKEVYPAGNTDTSQKWLTYTVRFQNTGTDTAFNIYIADTLDSNLDLSTFELTAFSHRPLVQIYEGGGVKFNFPNIMLPDSNVNEPLSHGYVQYKIKVKDNLPIGTQIQNTAYIYFDFNEPVVTNTTTNTITEDLITGLSKQPEIGNTVKLYPNPANNLVQLSVSGFIPQWVTVYDVNGKRVMEQKYATQLDVTALTNGVYFLEVNAGVSIARSRFVIM